ncbi:MAG: ribbon-helix-helix domain-containing protein [Promethearchaeota archaeon]
MSSNNTEPTKTPRLTFTIGEFDEKVIEKMALKRQVSKSEVIRTLIHNWIENNHDVLKNNYQIDFDEITNELLQDTLRITLDKSLKPFEEDIIKELPEFFELVDDVSVEDLTEHFNVDNKAIKRLIFVHAKEIKKLGLNLKLKEGRIFRIQN